MTDVPPPPSFGAPPPPGAGAPDVGAALSYGWKKFQSYAGPVLAVILVPLVAQLIVSIVGRVAVNSLFGSLLFGVIGFVIGAVGALGIYRTALMITAGETPDLAKAFQYDRWGEWLGFSIVYGLIVGIGFALCIIPGLVALAFFGMAPYFFIDRRMSVGDALRASREAASRNYAMPVVLAIIVGVLGIIACLIGVFVTAPVAYIAVAFLYRNAIGQTVAP